MGWREVSAMSERRELVRLAAKEGTNVRELCRRFEVSPTTAYKWIERAREAGETYADRSRRPKSSPNKTAAEIEARVLELRDEHPQWNARKLRRLLKLESGPHAPLPAASTVGAILRRNGRISEAASEAAQKWQRFEHRAPNDLWQIDFMGHFATGQGRCHALTVLDDHSRYAIVLKACTNERGETVRAHLIDAFRRYGLPLRMNMDNGNPWGNASGSPYTHLTVWVMELQVGISHSRPYHPQTNGKDERLHRTVRREVVQGRWFASIDEVDLTLTRWREVYNHERPHEALGLAVPADRYRVSVRPYPEVIRPFEYGATDLVRRVGSGGEVSVGGKRYYVGEAFRGRCVALRQTAADGVLDVFFCRQRVAAVDRRDPAAGI
jgi:transposase InsO family protein